MDAGGDSTEVKFRLFDGSDIGPNKYGPSTTVASLKEAVVSKWPRDLQNGPKTVSDVKLISGGKILENNRTLAESKIPVMAFTGGVITMHVVVRQPLLVKYNEKQHVEYKKSSRCVCCIL